MKNKVEGYWWSESTPEYPMPEIGVLTPEQAFKIYEKIVSIEQIAKKTTYRGPSHSRITGELLGNAEYQFADWTWPGDFAKHYVLHHRVRPSAEFLKFLGVEL